MTKNIGRQSVCLVCPSLKAGGTERVVAEFANFLAGDLTCDVQLILFSDVDSFYTLSDRVSVIALDSAHKSERLSTLRKFGRLRSTLKCLRPSAVLSFGCVYNSFVLVAALGLGLRVYVSDRSNPYRNTEFRLRRDPLKRHDGPIHYFLRKWLYPKAAGVLVQTEAARTIEQTFSSNRNIVMFPNPTRPIRYSNSSGRRNLNPEYWPICPDQKPVGAD